MPTYKIGDKEYLLEEISCIDIPHKFDANTVCINVWLKGCSEKTVCSIYAFGDQINPDSNGGTSAAFIVMAYSQFDEFITAWRTAQKIKPHA